MSPGRPKSVGFNAAFRKFVAQGKNTEVLFKTLIRKRPDAAMDRLCGKIPDHLEVDGSLSVLQECIARAREKAAKR
jgi:hypothetical protein